MHAQSCCERFRDGWLFRADPELIVHALDQLPGWSQSPRQLGEHLVLLVGPRKLRIRSGLTVVVAQILVAREEPQPVVNGRPAEVCREVTITRALVSALQLA